MNKKKLPNAIVQTPEAVHADSLTEQHAFISPQTERVRRARPGRQVIDMAPQREAPNVLVANDTGPVTARPDDSYVRRHRAMATRIVERHANFSAIGGVIPLPIVNIASVSAIILRMLKRLSQHYGVPFERDRARMVVIGLTGGCMPTGLAAATASTLSFVVPGANLFGLAVCSVTASTCTRGIGRLFIELFESGATWRDLPPAEHR